jgi:hypothetical protein
MSSDSHRGVLGTVRAQIWNRSMQMPGAFWYLVKNLANKRIFTQEK